MRQAAFLLGVMVFFAGTAGAQERLDNSAASIQTPAQSPLTVNVAPVTADAAERQGTASPELFAVAAGPSSEPVATVASAPAGGGDAAAALPQVSTNRPPPVQSVFASYNWEAYVGYTFVRFELASGLAKNTNGLNFSSQYFIHTGPFGIDGEGVATFASVAHQTGKFWTGMGGGRYRFAAPRGLEVWVHGLIGGAKFVPQTALGGQTGFAYEAGAGVDMGTFNHRLALRFAGDMLGTRFFGQNQFSPKVSAGIVFKY